MRRVGTAGNGDWQQKIVVASITSIAAADWRDHILIERAYSGCRAYSEPKSEQIMAQHQALHL